MEVLVAQSCPTLFGEGSGHVRMRAGRGEAAGKGRCELTPATSSDHSLQAFHLLWVPPPFSRSLVPMGPPTFESVEEEWVTPWLPGGYDLSRVGPRGGVGDLSKVAQRVGGRTGRTSPRPPGPPQASHSHHLSPQGPYLTKLVRELQHTPPWQALGSGHSGGWRSWGTGPQTVAQLECGVTSWAGRDGCGGAAAAVASSGSLCAPLPADFGSRSSHDFQ